MNLNKTNNEHPKRGMFKIYIVRIFRSIGLFLSKSFIIYLNYFYRKKIIPKKQPYFDNSLMRNLWMLYLVKLVIINCMCI